VVEGQKRQQVAGDPVLDIISHSSSRGTGFVLSLNSFIYELFYGKTVSGRQTGTWYGTRGRGILATNV